MKEEEVKKQNYLVSFITGGLGGACAKTSIAPLERIKMLFVTSHRKFTYSKGLKDAKYIYKNHGIKNFWRGNSANIIRVFPFSAIRFFDIVPSDHKVKRQIIILLCGGISGICAQTVCYPLETLWTRLTMQKNSFEYKNLFNAMKKIYQVEGLKGFYNGLQIASLGVVIYHGLGFLMVTNIKEFIQKVAPHKRNLWYTDFISGAIGGISGQITEGLLYITGQQEAKSTKSMDLIKIILKNEGVFKGLYKGFSINIIKTPIANGIAWTVKSVLNRKFDGAYKF